MNHIATGCSLVVAAVAVWAAIGDVAPTRESRPTSLAAAPESASEPELSDAALRVTGRVVDAAGQPVADVLVLASSLSPAASSRGPVSRQISHTDRSGRFAIRPLGPGTYSVLAIHKNHPPGWANLVVRAGLSGELTLRIVLDRDGDIIHA